MCSQQDGSAVGTGENECLDPQLWGKDCCFELPAQLLLL